MMDHEETLRPWYMSNFEKINSLRAAEICSVSKQAFLGFVCSEDGRRIQSICLDREYYCLSDVIRLKEDIREFARKMLL